MRSAGRFSTVRTLLLALVVLLSGQAVTGQVYPYVNYSVRQGLVNSNVYAIAQDQAGFIWLGTENGLSRFDGISFKNYTLAYLGLTSFISSLVAAPEGKIIFGNGINGIYLFDPVTEKITAVNKSKISLSNQLLIKNDLVISLKEYHFFEFISLSTGKSAFPDKVTLDVPANKALSMIQLKNDAILLGRSDGIYELLDGVQHKLPIRGLENSPVYSIYEDEHSLLVGSDGCIFRISNNIVVDTLKVISGEEKRIREILVDNRGNIWFNIWGLKDVYMISENNLTNVSEIAGINNGAITQIMQDKSGSIWVGVMGKGLFHFNNNHLLIYPSLSDLPNSNIRKIVKTQKGGLLMGTDDGIAYLDPAGKKMISGKHIPEMTQFVRDILEVYPNEFLVAITDIRLINPLKNSYSFSPENLKIQYAHGSSLWNDSNMILLGNWDNSILKYRRPSYQFLNTTELIFEGTNTQRINCLFRDKYSRLWVGSQRGLCILHNEEKYFPKSKLQQEEILKILPLKNETLLVVTQRGMYFYENNIRAQNVKELSSIPVQSTTCAVMTGENEYLVGTNYGLLFIKDHKTTLMNIHDGILSDNINDIYHETGTNTAWVATSEGLMRVDLAVIRKENDPPPVIDFIAFQQGNKSWVPLSNANFEYHQNSFRLAFHAFHYHNPSKIKYQYKVDDNDWLLSPSNEIQFASVEPGEHVIRIRAGLSNELWGPVKAVYLHVYPPFYRTWWFYVFVTFMGTVLILLFIRKQMRMLRYKQEEKVRTQQKMVELQQKALASNLNPHFVFNSLNAIQHFINSRSPAEANEYLAKFARLMRMHLNMAEKSSILLHEEIQRLEYYLSLEQMRFDDKMQWSITLDPSLDPFHLEIPNMIIQPFVENAIWHGIMPSTQMGFISLDIKQGPRNELMITITDNGVGFNQQPKTPKNQYESKGTRLIRERLLLLDPSVPHVLRFEHLSPGTRVGITLSSRMYRKTMTEEPVSQA